MWRRIIAGDAIATADSSTRDSAAESETGAIEDDGNGGQRDEGLLIGSAAFVEKAADINHSARLTAQRVAFRAASAVGRTRDSGRLRRRRFRRAFHLDLAAQNGAPFFVFS